MNVINTIVAVAIAAALGAAANSFATSAELEARVELLEGSMDALLAYAEGRMNEEAREQVQTLAATGSSLAEDGSRGGLVPGAHSLAPFFNDAADLDSLGASLNAARETHSATPNAIKGWDRVERELLAGHLRTVESHWASRIVDQFSVADKRGVGEEFLRVYDSARELWVGTQTGLAALPRWKELVQMSERQGRRFDDPK